MGGGPEHKLEHLLVTLPFPEPTQFLERIKKNHPYLKITYKQISTTAAWDKSDGLPKELWQDVTLLATLSTLPPTPKDCPNLELIHFFSAGTNHVANHPIYTDSKIILTTSSGIHGPPISEWVIMTMLVASHSYNQLHHWQIDHVWGKGHSHRLQLTKDKVGQRFGVLGYGSIGRQAAKVAKAMGMDVIAYTASPRKTPESKKDRGFIVPGTGDPDGEFPSEWYSGLDKPSLHNFLSQDIDHLLISVPLTKQTTHFLAAEEFEILGRKNTFITNISRGQIVQQDDLIAALKRGADDTQEGGLRGAALDVTDPEPLPEDSALWDAPNCIVTPHISSLGQAYADRAFQVLELNLTKRENGESLVNVVNRERGY